MSDTLADKPLILSREQYDLPETRVGLLALMERVLMMPGPVQSFSMEVDQPIRVMRWVESNELFEGEPTLGHVLSTVNMTEVSFPGMGPEVLFAMFAALERDRCYPVCWAIGAQNRALLDNWLGILVGDTLANVPIERLKSLPEETILLCGAELRGGSVTDIKRAIKTTIGWRKEDEPKHEDVDRVRSASNGGGPAAGEVEGAGGRDGRTGWNPPRVPGWGQRSGT